jgi:hypothetical protein
MEIQVPAGSHVGYLGDTKSRYADEKEALLPRGGRYEVLSVDKGPNGTVVKLAYSPGEKRALPPKPGFFKRLLGVGGEEMFAEIGELTAADQPASEDRAERFTWRKDQIVMNG